MYDDTQKFSLKKYLVEKDNGYLFDIKNNTKTIMLSGAWGAGKTYFWKNEIEPQLDTNNQAYTYISLYGQESLQSIKTTIFVNDSSFLSKSISTFGIEALSAIKNSDLGMAKLFSAFQNLEDARQIEKGIERLKDGGIICFDDFERKSKNIDLNDLFGFIAQLAINLKVKIVIILNSEVFKGKESEVFTNVKEKTINKFLYFKPTIKELFESIYEDSKYSTLDSYKQDILKTIEETKELNARVYIQVLDNCLEWLDLKKDINSDTIRTLVLSTINFVLNHLIIDYIKKENPYLYSVQYPYQNIFSITISQAMLDEDMNSDFTNIKMNDEAFFENLKSNLYKQKDQVLENKEILHSINNSKSHIIALYKYGFRLNYSIHMTKDKYCEIMKFIETGILL